LDPLHRWPIVQPDEYKTYGAFKKAFRAECAPYVTKMTAKNSDNQLAKFVSRIKPIHDIIWTLITKDRSKGKHGKEQSGVSTFCHLEGLSDQKTLDLLIMVYNLFHFYIP